MLGIVAYLLYELRDISWTEIGAALPTNPLFYLLFLVLYFLLPVAECFVYRITWTFEAWKSFPAFVKKRIYNNDILGYSGEVYFYTWARKNTPFFFLPGRLKDGVFLRAFVSLWPLQRRRFEMALSNRTGASATDSGAFLRFFLKAARLF